MLVILKIYSPVFDDSVGHGALRVDEGRNVQVLVAAEVRGGAVQQQQGEALEVVVGGAAGDGEAGHAGQQPQDVLRVRAELCQQLDPGVEASLAHDGQRRAEVGGRAVGVRAGLQQQPRALPVLVDEGDEERGLGLGVQTVDGGPGSQQQLNTVRVTRCNKHQCRLGRTVTHHAGVSCRVSS